MSEREDRSRLSEIMQVLRRYRITKGITPVKVREILEELGPTYVKLGQILSIRTDLISSEYCKELQKLRSQVSPMPYDEVRAVLCEAYKKDPEDVFASIVKTPIGSASIAQVHEAFLKSGEHVVLKVQRRGIYGTMERAGTATYLSRSDWDGTFPTTITGLKAEDRLATLLANDFIDIKTDEDTSDIVFGDTTSTLTLNDLKGADFDDPRWDELVGKVTIDEFLNFASNAFHNIQNIDSVGLLQYAADDGPNGSDSHYLTEGSYQGTPYADAADYDYGTRVGPTPENIAYSWNKELAYRVGEITLGESTLVLNLPIMIGPGMNIHRHGYNARGAEYYSEDPVLSGYTGSAVVQGAQSKGTLVNIKHAAFNDQEINRSGIAVFMTEQKARELELRNLQQAFEGNGKPASFEADPSRDDTYTVGALGVMSSYNRIGAVASSANAGVQVQIMRNEWGFKGYNVTDFTGVTLHASPKESILAGTTAFCGFGKDDSITYWNADALKGDRTMLLAIKQNIHYLLYALANSAAMNGVNSTTRTISVMTWWRMTYRVCIYGFAALTALCALLYVVSAVKSKKQKTAKEA